MKGNVRFTFLALLFLHTGFVFPLDDPEHQQLLERIQPVGKVHVEGTTSQTTPSTAQPIESNSKKPGEEIYKTYCSTCHQSGLAGAPKFQDKNDWAPRLKAKDRASLTASAIKGLNAMPAKGTCSTCSDQDIQEAIQYMIPTL